MSSSVDSVVPVNSPLIAGQVETKTSPVEKSQANEVALKASDVSSEEIFEAVEFTSSFVDSIVPKSLTFKIEEDLSRMVVAVRAVGSDEIIRQFPPEEFITVAKFIAAQEPDHVSEDFLKGILFDKYT